MIITSDSPDATRALAARLGSRLRVGDVVALIGDLGAGKTCFVQGLAQGMGIDANVTSPTFILMRRHPGNPPLCHADAYRLNAPAELEDLGLDDVLAVSVLAIEWAERVLDALPEERIDVTLTTPDGPPECSATASEGPPECSATAEQEVGPDHHRRIDIAAHGDRLAALVREAFE